ncbi:U2 snRNP auxiliary factor large subunit, partial [Coniochaeta hoffmannii]
GRDRGGRSGGRRDDDRSDRRGGRDLFDDRRGGGGRRDGGGGGRRGGGDDFEQEMRGQARGRTASPGPPKKREPTPDLTDVVPVTERKRRLTQWDIKPPGYENVTAEQAKLSGMFPLPGAPRQQAMDPTKLQAFMNQPGGSVNSAALKPTNSRQAKRLIVSNLPPSATEEDITNFFNLQMNGLNVVDGTDPVVLCQIAPNHAFAMLEFRSSADATVAYALDGISMEAADAANGNGAAPSGLVIKRPKDYIVPAVVDEVPYEQGVVSSVVVDTPSKISVANIPSYLTEEQVMELLTSFGELKAFVLVKDQGTGESRGIAFCEYVDPAATEVALTGLNGMEIGEKRLVVRKASIGVTQVAGEMSVNAMSMLAGTTSTDPDISRVLQLLNMVTPEELMDNDDYEEIKEDVQEECSKYGTILEVKIPRPSGPSRSSAGVGKIFVKYDSPEGAQKALRALAGRKFADRTVVTTFFPEENFDVGAW